MTTTLTATDRAATSVPGFAIRENSATALVREAEGFRSAEARDPETLDFVDLCVYVGLKPSRIREMVAGVDRHDEIAVDSAIRSGIHKMAPSLDGDAHLFVRHFYLAAPALDMAAE